MGALEGLANLRDERALPHVFEQARYGRPARSRRAAVLALPKISNDRRVRERLEDLLDDATGSADPHLRVDIARALGDLGHTKSRAALHSHLDCEHDGRVKRRIREILQELGAEVPKDFAQLRDELEAVRNEHAELKTRLGKIEASLKEPKASS